MADSRKLVYAKYLEKADSRKLVLAKCDFCGLAKINPIKVLKNDRTHLKHTLGCSHGVFCMNKLQGLAL